MLSSVVAPDGAPRRPLLRLGPPVRVRPRRRRLSRGLLPAVAAARVGVHGTAAATGAAAGEHHEGRRHHVGGIPRCVAEVDGVSSVVMLVGVMEMGLLLLLIEPREEPVVVNAGLV